MTMNKLLLLLSLLAFLAPATAFSAPGDAAPDFGDDDDDEEEEEDEDEAPAPEPEPEDEADEPAEEEADEEDEDLDLPDVGVDEPEEEEVEESEEDVDDRYRVTAPGDEPEEETEEDREAAKAELEEERKVGLVKVIQKKFFLKYRRLEVMPMFGYMGTDDFIQRIAVGGAVGFHINDVISVEAMFNYLPNLNEADYKPLTQRLRNRDEVVPDISRLMFLGVLNLAISPIYGKVELGTLRIINYDLFVTAGAGVAGTVDDTFIIQSPCDGLPRREAKATAGCEFVHQEHFVTNIGGGLRLVFNEWIGVRVDGRTFMHIEQTFRDGEVGLDMKQNFMVSIGASLFFPPKARTIDL